MLLEMSRIDHVRLKLGGEFVRHIIAQSAVIKENAHLSIRTKVLLLAVLPLILLAGVLYYTSTILIHQVFNDQSEIVKENLLKSKENELDLLLDIAFSMISPILQNNNLTELEKQNQVKKLLGKQLFFKKDGYFFVYDVQGINLVHPMQPELVGQSLWNYQDKQGTYVIRGLLTQAKRGSGVVRYIWSRPSTHTEEEKLGRGRMLEPWGWMIGTGLYDVRSEINRSIDKVRNKVNQVFEHILILLGCSIATIILLVFLVNLHESRLSTRHLQELIHNFINLQIEERRQFSRELHDGIGQLLVAAKYGIELALRQLTKGNTAYQTSLQTTQTTLDTAIHEVRRVSHGLRPVVWHMGLAAALQHLVEQFRSHSTTQVNLQLWIDSKTIPDDAGIMLYRVIQEALTNISRHAKASQVDISLQQIDKGLVLDLIDNGIGFQAENLNKQGIGIKNMRERMELLGGNFQLTSAIGKGTHLHAFLPLRFFSKR